MQMKMRQKYPAACNINTQYVCAHSYSPHDAPCDSPQNIAAAVFHSWPHVLSLLETIPWPAAERVVGLRKANIAHTFSRSTFTTRSRNFPRDLVRDVMHDGNTVASKPKDIRCPFQYKDVVFLVLASMLKKRPTGRRSFDIEFPIPENKI